MTARTMLVQLGAGTVGRAVVRLVLANRERWRRQYDLEVEYLALLDSAGALVGPDGALKDEELARALDAKARGGSVCDVGGARNLRVRDLVAGRGVQWNAPTASVTVLDCAAGEGTYDDLLGALGAGWSAALSNKAPLAVSQERHEALHAQAGGRLRYEATVGAGLPVIHTLRSLLCAGDEIREIVCCASGTLGFLTSELMAGRAYSDAVRRARELGYTEPDPRDDLSGLDVARKALILARTSGRRLELGDILVEPLLPVRRGVRLNAPTVDAPPVNAGTVEEFLEQVRSADEEFGERVERARRDGGSLKYVARVPADGQVTVRLEEVPARSQMGSLSGPDNIYSFRTREYDEHPLCVIGPGAGPVQTAMGVLTDVLTGVGA